MSLQEDKLILEVPAQQPRSRSKRQRRDAANEMLELVVKKTNNKPKTRRLSFTRRRLIPTSIPLQVQFGHGEWLVGSVYYARKDDIPLAVIIPGVIVPMLVFIAVSVYCYRLEQNL